MKARLTVLKGASKAFAIAVTWALTLSACAVTGGGYTRYDGYAEDSYPVYIGGVYEPYGYPYGYGGWGPRYHVGPPRGGAPYLGGTGHDRVRGAPSGRPMPSVPGRSRGGAPHRR